MIGQLMKSKPVEIEVHSKYEPSSALFIKWKIVSSERTSSISICCLFDRNDSIEMICGAKMYESTMHACMCAYACMKSLQAD